MTWRRNPWLVAYFILVALVVFGFARVESLATAVEDEADRRSEAFCFSLVEQRLILANVLELSLSTQSNVDISSIRDPELRRLVEASRDRQRDFFEAVQPLLQPPPCVDELKLDLSEFEE